MNQKFINTFWLHSATAFMPSCLYIKLRMLMRLNVCKFNAILIWLRALPKCLRFVCTLHSTILHLSIHTRSFIVRKWTKDGGDLYMSV